VKLGEAVGHPAILERMFYEYHRHSARCGRPWFHMQRMPGPSDRPSTLSRVTRELRIDSTVVLVVLFTALALGAGSMLVLAGGNTAAPSSPPTAGATTNAIAALGSPHPTATPAATAGGSQPPPTATALGPTLAPPTPEPTPTAPPRPTSAAPAVLTGYVWPLVNARISSPFGGRAGGFMMLDGQPYHDGLDLATWCGDKIRAAHDGTVLYAGRKFDRFLGYSQDLGANFYPRSGNLDGFPIVVVIDDGNGYRSIYVHLSVAKVGAGDVVKAGQLIGYEGATGHATGCHLHFGLIRMDGPYEDVNPTLLNLYPPAVRERVDPLLVLPLRDPDAATRFLERYPQPSQPRLPFDPPPPDPGPG
jgi:murein DD-endopeptidase MepM/ murein hydrolase activator NlpD